MARSPKLIDKKQSAKRIAEPKPTLLELPSVDPTKRYPIAIACAYLSISRGKLYEQVKTGEVRLLKDGRLSFVAGAEIIRKSTLSVAA